MLFHTHVPRFKSRRSSSMIAHKLAVLAAALSLAISQSANAFPQDTAALKQVVDGQYGGNANAYAEAEQNDLKRMACEGRAGLLQALIDQGLALSELSYPAHYQALKCALEKKQTDAFILLLTPHVISDWEDRCAGNYGCWMPLRSVIQKDDYTSVRAVLENGPHYFFEHKDFLTLTREEHLVLAARTAIDDAKDESQRAFIDAGFGNLLEAARNKRNIKYIDQRTDEAGGGGIGGGLLGGIAGIAGGAAIGGSVGTGIMARSGLETLDSKGAATREQALPPLKLESGRAQLGFRYMQQREPTRAILIDEIMAGSSSERAGLMKGDIITHIAGTSVASRGSIYVATRKANAQESYEVRYLRKDTPMTALFGQAAQARAPAFAPTDTAEATALAEPTLAPAAGSNTGSTLQELEKLADLHDRGVLSEEEFRQMKARILGAD